MLPFPVTKRCTKTSDVEISRSRTYTLVRSGKYGVSSRRKMTDCVIAELIDLMFADGAVG